jgi:precorrin-2 dehydrogenase/sirohydrochlorin ferrochelatase
MKRTPTLFALFLKLEGKTCLVIGGGAIAESKLQALLHSGARVIVIAPEVTRRIAALAKRSKLEWRPRPFATADVKGAFLAVAATNSPAVNHAVFAACSRRGVLCNVVDDPDYCDFYYPAVVRRGMLQIAVSTGGASPSLARRLRQQLERNFPSDYAAWLRHLAQQRQKLQRANLPAGEKRAALEHLSSHAAYREFIQSAKAKSKPSEKSSSSAPQVRRAKRG